MAGTGRKPLPTATKELRGNPGKRPLTKNEPTPAVCVDIPKLPTWVKGEARREWKRMAPHLMKIGLLTELDTTALTLYCRTYMRWVEAEKQIDAIGAVWTSPETGYTQQTAWVSIANSEFGKLKAMLTEFGMTPSSRSRISLPKAEAEEDEFEQLFGNSETVNRKRKTA